MDKGRMSLVAVFGACALGVQAATIADDLVIDADTNVVVNSGTDVWSGTISGSGTITKSGNGTLQLLYSNPDLNCNWVVEAGTLYTGTTISKGGANSMGKQVPFLGNGKVTVKASTEHESCVWVYTSVLTNSIEVIGKSSVAHPAIKAGNQSSYGGPITADDDLYIYQIGYASGTSPFNDKLIFQDACTITAPGKTVSMRPNAQFKFKDLANYIVCDTLETTSSGTTGCGSVYLGSNRNSIRLIRTNKARIVCGISNCFGGAALGWYGQDTANGFSTYILYGTASQTAAYLTSDECFEAGTCYSISNNPSSSSVTALTLTGGVAEATAYCKLTGKFSLTVSSTDGAAFKQNLLGRRHSMTGPITVNANATLALGGGTVFEAVQQVNVNGGTLQVGGGSSFADVKQVKVDGGTLEIVDGTPFANYQVAFVLTNGGKIKLGSDVQLRVKSVTVDGTEKVGTFTKDSEGTMVEGEGTLVSFGSDPITLVWATDDEAANVNTASSWQDSPVFDFSVPDKFITRFAAADAGARANVSSSIDLNRIEFTAENGFTIAAAGDGAAISLGSGGLETTAVTGEDPVTRRYQVEVPVTAAVAQYWTPGTDTVTTFTNFTVDATVTMTNGHGKVEFYGTTTLNAELKNWYKKFASSGTKTVTDDMGRTMLFNGRVEGTGTLSNHGWNGAYIVLSNAVVACPIYWYGTGSHDWSYRWFTCPPNTTNRITGAMSCQSATYFKIDSGARLEFAGGGTFGNKISINSGGTLVVTNLPISSTTVATENNAFLGAAATSSRFVLAASSNRFARTLADGIGSTFEYGADYTVSWDCIKEVENNCIDLDNSSNDSRFEFNGTRQRYRSLRNNKTNKGATLHGVYPSSLGVYFNSTNCTPITGCLSLEKLADEEIGGADQELVLGARAYESYGDLKVNGGTLAFLPGGTWLNGTNVTVCGTGILKLPSGGVFGGNHAVLHVDDTGKIDIPVNCSQAFSAAFVGGMKVSAGTYTAAQPGAFAGHFADDAAGSIVVRNFGTRIILR